jgi:hypothetical protein
VLGVAVQLFVNVPMSRKDCPVHAHRGRRGRDGARPRARLAARQARSHKLQILARRIVGEVPASTTETIALGAVACPSVALYPPRSVRM